MAYFGYLGFPLLVFFDGFPSYRLKLIASLGVHKWIMGASVCAHKCEKADNSVSVSVHMCERADITLFRCV